MTMENSENTSLRYEKRGIEWKKLSWPVVLSIGAMHVGCLFAPFYFSWSALVITVLLFWVSGCLGITLCFHRLLTHRSFKTPKWFEYLLTLTGCLALEGGPIQWVGTHRIHHLHSDEEMDPHTPKHGFGWAHVFWCMHKDPEGRNATEAAKDLQRDPVHRFIDRFFYLPQFLLLGLLFGAGELAAHFGLETSGLSWFIWGGCIRSVLVYHVTWFVNSASHTWGYRNYETSDHSTNLWWVSILGFGEGWHNNHHAHQRSAAHGLRWFEFDLTYLIIRLLALMGLASNVVLPKPDQLPKNA